MWQRSFVAMTVLCGGTVDDALEALSPTPHSSNVEPLVTKLRASSRATRATALAEALREIVLAVEGVTLG
jgi:hypothetical protein